MQGGRWVTARTRGRGANSSPETASSTKLRAGSQLLTKSSWDPGQLISARRVAVRDQLPRGDTWHTWDSSLAAHPGNRVAGTGEVIKTHHPPGECTLDKHLVAWAARTWEGHKTQAQPSLCLCEIPENLNLSSIDLRSAHNPGPPQTVPSRATWSLSSVDQETKPPWVGANPVWPRHCEHSPHTPVIFVCSVPPSLQHNWTSVPK